MRKIKIIQHVSLDGVMQHENSEDFIYGGWTTPFRSAEGFQTVLAAHGNDFDLLLGRRTYDQWTAYWPKAGDNPMANRLNAATKYIATHRPDSMEWGPVEDLGINIIEGIRKLKASEGSDLVVCGSSTLVSLLLSEGLADELVLIVYPVLLGSGKRFFSESVAAQQLTFVNSVTTPTGVQVNTYQYSAPLQAS